MLPGSRCLGPAEKSAPSAPGVVSLFKILAPMKFLRGSMF